MDWLISLIMLVALEAVLGIDNLLYIAIESGRVDSSQQTRVQRIGIFGAVIMRVALLLLLVQLIQWFQLPFATVHWEGVLKRLSTATASSPWWVAGSLCTPQ